MARLRRRVDIKDTPVSGGHIYQRINPELERAYEEEEREERYNFALLGVLIGLVATLVGIVLLLHLSGAVAIPV